MYVVAGRYGGDGAQSKVNRKLSSRLAWLNFHFFTLPTRCEAMKVVKFILFTYVAACVHVCMLVAEFRFFT